MQLTSQLKEELHQVQQRKFALEKELISLKFCINVMAKELEYRMPVA
jgi:hypothetical protein